MVPHVLGQVGSLSRSTAGKELGADASGCGVEAGQEKRGVLIFELDLEKSVPSWQYKVACWRTSKVPR